MSQRLPKIVKLTCANCRGTRETTQSKASLALRARNGPFCSADCATQHRKRFPNRYGGTGKPRPGASAHREAVDPINKRYRTENGCRVRFDPDAPVRDRQYPLKGWIIQRVGREIPAYWTQDGFYGVGRQPCEFNLVEE